MLEPLAGRHYFINGLLVEFDFMARDYAMVEKRLSSLKAAAGMDTTQYYLQRANAYHFAGDDRRALQFADSALAFMEARKYARSDHPGRLGSYATALAMRDRDAEALRAINRAMEIMPVERDAMAGVDVRNERAIMYIIMGEYDLAIQELEYLLSIPSGFSPVILRLHPGFDELRDDPRFKRLAEEKVSS